MNRLNSIFLLSLGALAASLSTGCEKVRVINRDVIVEKPATGLPGDKKTGSNVPSKNVIAVRDSEGNILWDDTREAVAQEILKLKILITETKKPIAQKEEASKVDGAIAAKEIARENDLANHQLAINAQLGRLHLSLAEFLPFEAIFENITLSAQHAGLARGTIGDKEADALARGTIGKTVDAAAVKTADVKEIKPADSTLQVAAEKVRAFTNAETIRLAILAIEKQKRNEAAGSLGLSAELLKRDLDQDLSARDFEAELKDVRSEKAITLTSIASLLHINDKSIKACFDFKAYKEKVQKAVDDAEKVGKPTAEAMTEAAQTVTELFF